MKASKLTNWTVKSREAKAGLSSVERLNGDSDRALPNLLSICSLGQAISRIWKICPIIGSVPLTRAHFLQIFFSIKFQNSLRWRLTGSSFSYNLRNWKNSGEDQGKFSTMIGNLKKMNWIISQVRFLLLFAFQIIKPSSFLLSSLYNLHRLEVFENKAKMVLFPNFIVFSSITSNLLLTSVKWRIDMAMCLFSVVLSFIRRCFSAICLFRRSIFSEVALDWYASEHWKEFFFLKTSKTHGFFCDGIDFLR